MAASHHSGNGSTLSIGQVSERLGCSISTVRLMANEGVLLSTRLTRSQTSHRRFSAQSVAEYLGEPTEAEPETANSRCVAYARVSSANSGRGFKKYGEDSKSQLVSQIGRLREWAKKEMEIEELEVYSDCGLSGVSFARPGFNRVIKKILNNEISTLLVCTPDRLSRIAVSFVEMIAQIKNVEIIYIEDKPISDESFSQTLSEVVALITHFAARVHGARASERRRIGVPSETLRIAYELQTAGMPYREIIDELAKRKLHDNRGRPLKLSTLRLNLMKMEKISEEFKAKPDETVSKFIEAKITINQNDKKARIQYVKLEEEYLKFCISKNLKPLTRGKCTKEFRKQLKSNSLIGGKRFFKGIEFKE